MKKITIISIIVVLILLAGAFYFFNKKTPDQAQEQVVLEKTLTISQKYTDLRYQTENVLEKAEDFNSYDSWNTKMEEIIKGWKELENEAIELEKQANKLSDEKVSFNFVEQALAYDKQEVSRVINSGSIKNQISRLAKHFGVDAKRAQLILNETQDQVSSEAYAEEGDVFEKCEQNSMRIKNGAKVTVFVGTVVLTGGVAGVVGSGAIATAGTVVAGADLALEITEDEARIALGDRNKVTEMAGSIRSVTEPAASILSIVNIPGNLSKAVDKFSAISFAADQVRSSIQDKKIIGISIQTNDKGEVKAEVAGLTPEELPKWRTENNGNPSNETVEEIINSAKMVAEKEVVETEKESENKQSEDKKDEISKTPNNEIKLMPVKEFEELFDDFKIENISDVKEIFGEPDVINTFDDGYGNYIYHRRLVYPNGNIAGMTIRFQNLDVSGYSIMME